MVALAVMCTGWGRCMGVTSAKLEGTMEDVKDGDDGRGGRKGRYDVRTTSKSNVLEKGWMSLRLSAMRGPKEALKY
jgi:hypothetical protein